MRLQLSLTASVFVRLIDGQAVEYGVGTCTCEQIGTFVHGAQPENDCKNLKLVTLSKDQGVTSDA